MVKKKNSKPRLCSLVQFYLRFMNCLQFYKIKLQIQVFLMFAFSLIRFTMFSDLKQKQLMFFFKEYFC